MKKMFTLRGVSNSGKSEKIKDIANWIVTTYPPVRHTIDFNQSDIHGIIQFQRLKIGIVAPGDDLECVEMNDSLINNHPDIDILINTSRTKGCTRQHLEKKYNRSTDWLVVNIFVQHYSPSNLTLQQVRDNIILNELRTWLMGLPY